MMPVLSPGLLVCMSGLTAPVLPVGYCHTPDVTINCAIFRQEDSGHVNCNMLSAPHEQATIQYSVSMCCLAIAPVGHIGRI